MKELSQLKPDRAGDPARPVIFESSLTHIKYKYEGDQTSTNLIAFNNLGSYAINKNGGVFTGPIQVKSATSSVVNVTSTDGVLTINLGFGSFFRVRLTENIEYIDVINTAPEEASTFTLIIANDLAGNQYSIKFRPADGSSKLFKAYPSDFYVLDYQNYVFLSPFTGCKDIVSFKTVDGSTFFISLSGLDYKSGGYLVYGTYIRSEINYISIEGVSYANGTLNIVANGTGGETNGNYNYPPDYPETGYVLFKSEEMYVYGDSFPQEFLLDFPEYGSTFFKTGDFLTVSDGIGGYRQVNSYYPDGTFIIEKDIYADIDTYGNKRKVGRRMYLWNGNGQATVTNIYDYTNGQVLPNLGYIGFAPTLAEDQWYDWATWKSVSGAGGDTMPYNTMVGGFYAVISNGDFTVRFEYSYLEEGTVYGYWPRYIGAIYVDYFNDNRYDSNFYRKLFVPSKLVADGNGKYRMETLLSDGAYVPMFHEYFVFDLFNNLNYSQYGYAPSNPSMYDGNLYYWRISCGNCIPYSLQSSNTPACYSNQFESNCGASAYVLRASYNAAGWSSNTAPPLGQGYFNPAVIRDKTVDENGSVVADYDFVTNPENRPWELFTFNPYFN